MLFAIFVLIIFCEVILAIKFSRMASSITQQSNKDNVEIFGRRYRSSYELYMDFSFLNDLFSGHNISTISNETLKANLSSMRMNLIIQLMGGLLFLIVGIVLGITQQ